MISTFRCSYQVPPGVSGELVATTQPNKKRRFGTVRFSLLEGAEQAKLVVNPFPLLSLQGGPFHSHLPTWWHHIPGYLWDRDNYGTMCTI